MHERRFALAFLVMVMALTPLLTGCGLFGDDDEDGEESDTATEEVDDADDGETPDATEEPEQTVAEDGTPEADSTPGEVAPAPGDGTPAEGEPSPGEVGAEIFSTVCAACHQPEGEGIEGIYPALAGNPFVTNEDPTAVIDVVLTGRGGMPRFADAYTNEEIAAVISYLRTNLGNDASEVSPDQVDEVRQSLGPDQGEEAGEGGSGQSPETEGEGMQPTPEETPN